MAPDKSRLKEHLQFHPIFFPRRKLAVLACKNANKSLAHKGLLNLKDLMPSKLMRCFRKLLMPSGRPSERNSCGRMTHKDSRLACVNLNSSELRMIWRRLLRCRPIWPANPLQPSKPSTNIRDDQTIGKKITENRSLRSPSPLPNK